MSGTEVTIAGRTFVAESPRSIALRNFCSRLLGWGDDRIAVVDHALRAIRLASAGRAPLTLTGSGDLVPIAHAIHRYALGNEVPFIVSDPRRKNTSATVRTPANYPSGVDALRKATGGSLCVRAKRLPEDFAEILYAFRAPDCTVRLMVCSHQTSLPNAAQIDIPSLASRPADIPRIVSEYIEDAAHALGASDDCLDPADVEWILDHAAHKGELTMSGIEKAALRAVALKISAGLTNAAKLLKMARVSLERWIERRNGDCSESPEETDHEIPERHPSCDVHTVSVMIGQQAKIPDEHDKETQVQIQHAQPILIDTYNHALIDLGHAVAKATGALADDDAELFRISANEAVSAWIATDAACRSLAQEIGEQPSVEAARFELRQRCDDLQELLTTAASRFAGATLQDAINYMRESLAIACGERPNSALPTRI